MLHLEFDNREKFRLYVGVLQQGSFPLLPRKWSKVRFSLFGWANCSGAQPLAAIRFSGKRIRFRTQIDCKWNNSSMSRAIGEVGSKGQEQGSVTRHSLSLCLVLSACAFVVGSAWVGFTHNFVPISVLHASHFTASLLISPSPPSTPLTTHIGQTLAVALADNSRLAGTYPPLLLLLLLFVAVCYAGCVVTWPACGMSVMPTSWPSSMLHALVKARQAENKAW